MCQKPIPMDKAEFRQTIPGQPTVSDIVSYGDTCRTSYGTEGKVIKVHRSLVLSYPTYTIIYVSPETWKRKRKFQVCDYHWINELVAIDGRILKLLVANSVEVFIEKTVDSSQQLELF